MLARDAIRVVGPGRCSNTQTMTEIGTATDRKCSERQVPGCECPPGERRARRTGCPITVDRVTQRVPQMVRVEPGAAGLVGLPLHPLTPPAKESVDAERVDAVGDRVVGRPAIVDARCRVST
jgi:hypothetical protein